MSRINVRFEKKSFYGDLKGPIEKDLSNSGVGLIRSRFLVVGGTSIGKLALCVKAKGAARYGGSGLSY
jgi:hypothetical protein